MTDAFERIPDLCNARSHSGKLLLGLDFDGTLAAIVPRPADAALVDGAAPVLDRLAARADTVLAIVTGRAVADARTRTGLGNIHYAGNHGLEIEGPGLSWLHPSARASRATLDAMIAALQDALRPWPGIILEDKNVSMSVHFRTIEDPAEDARIVERVHAVARSIGGPVRLTGGKKVVEIRPDVDWDKGRALVFLREKLNLSDAPTVFIGDDRTDEDAFRELNGPHDAAILVGPTRTDTQATAVLRSTSDVVRFLSVLADS
jgi:trehalose 6-phosphate phosphatase